MLSDIRLAIGFSACAIAAGAFYYDFQVGFEASKTVMLYAVISYYVLNTLLTFWILWVETGAVYIGERNGLKVCVILPFFVPSPEHQLTSVISVDKNFDARRKAHANIPHGY